MRVLGWARPPILRAVRAPHQVLRQKGKHTDTDKIECSQVPSNPHRLAAIRYILCP